ncbi:MAG: glycosyltransferase family 4 protein, partial [Pirellulales bacterium]|nr:glycosyltransferase family 4 protein [Pirellulales bacterium]
MGCCDLLSIGGDPLHVVLLMEHPSLNGGERSTLAFCDQLRQQGFQFTAIAPPHADFSDTLTSHQIHHVPFSFRSPEGNRYPLDRLRAKLTDELQKLPVDLFHAISLSTARIAGPVVRKLRLPSIGHIRDIMTLSRQAMNDVNENDLILAVSKAALDYHRRAGLSSDKSAVLYNGIDLLTFKPTATSEELHRSLGLSPDSILLGAAGQVIIRKGLDTLVKGFLIASKKYPKVHLVIAGRRHSDKEETLRHEKDLNDFVVANKLDHRVHFLGYQNNMHPFYASLRMFLHCARQEPLGRVLLEAAAYGIPVIATNVGGTNEIFKRRDQGIIIEPDQPEQLAAEISNLIDAPDSARHIGANGRTAIEDSFDIRNASI